MDLHISLVGTGDLTAQLYAQLRDAVLDGRLAGGARVPATRELASSLSVSRGTVTAAYDRLVAEELLESRPGAGTFVASGCVPPAPARGRRARPGAVAPVDLWATPGEPARGPGAAAYDFSVGVPDASLFPLATWRRLVSGTLRRGRLSVGPYDERGPEPARDRDRRVCRPVAVGGRLGSGRGDDGRGAAGARPRRARARRAR